MGALARLLIFSLVRHSRGTTLMTPSRDSQILQLWPDARRGCDSPNRLAGPAGSFRQSNSRPSRYRVAGLGFVAAFMDLGHRGGYCRDHSGCCASVRPRGVRCQIISRWLEYWFAVFGLSNVGHMRPLWMAYSVAWSSLTRCGTSLINHSVGITIH